MKPNGYSDKVLVEHMHQCITRIQSYTQEGRSAFMHSLMIQDAVIRNIQTLAESSQRLSDELKASESGIPWKNMAGMRNILVHEYLGDIDVDVVWEVVQRHLPELEQALNRLIQQREKNKP